MPAAARQLTKQIVTFLDVLGFTDKMRAVASDAAASQDLLESYTTALTQALARITDDDPFMRHRGFTDNFLLAVELMAAHPESTLGHVTTKVAEFQLSMALEGWFVRGGISIGQFFMDDMLVFGDALLDAHDLESRVARDPRVVLSKHCVTLIKHFLSYYADPYHDAPQNGYVLVDTDGHAFINYLYVPRGYDGDVKDTAAVVEQHKARAEEALTASLHEPRIWAKYQWVAAYHDFFCDTWLPDEMSHLKIAPELLRTRPRLIVQSPEDNASFCGPGDRFGLPSI